MNDEKLIEVRDLVKHFPIRAGVLQRQIGAVQRGRRRLVRRDARRDAGDRRRVGLRQVDDGAAAAATDRADERLDRRTKAATSRRCRASELMPLRREMQMIFQDPYSSLNPRKTVGSIIGEPFVIHDIERERAARKKQRPGADGAGRAQPRALQPLPARVLRRPAPAHRRRARDRAEAGADRRRRAGLRARRLDPGAGHQPAARPSARPRT